MKASTMTLSTEISALVAKLGPVARGEEVGDAHDIISEIAHLAGREIARGWISVSSADDVAAEMSEFAGGDWEYINQTCFPAIVNALGGDYAASATGLEAEESVPFEARKAIAAFDVRTVSEGYAAEVADAR